MAISRVRRATLQLTAPQRPTAAGEQALASRRVTRAGGDPRAASRRRANGMPTFEEAAAKVIAIHGAAWTRQFMRT